jgi:hypothetical protein
MLAMQAGTVPHFGMPPFLAIFSRLPGITDSHIFNASARLGNIIMQKLHTLMSILHVIAYGFLPLHVSNNNNNKTQNIKTHHIWNVNAEVLPVKIRVTGIISKSPRQ